MLQVCLYVHTIFLKVFFSFLIIIIFEVLCDNTIYYYYFIIFWYSCFFLKNVVYFFLSADFYLPTTPESLSPSHESTNQSPKYPQQPGRGVDRDEVIGAIRHILWTLEGLANSMKN